MSKTEYVIAEDAIVDVQTEEGGTVKKRRVIVEWDHPNHGVQRPTFFFERGTPEDEILDKLRSEMRKSMPRTRAESGKQGALAGKKL